MSIENVLFKISSLLLFLLLGLSTFTLAQEAQKKTDDSLTQLLTEEIRNKYFYVKDFSNGRAVFHGKNCLWGYLDETLNELIPATFDRTYDFEATGLAKVELKRGYAYIDKQGDLVTQVAGRLDLQLKNKNRAILITNDPESAVIYDVENQKRLTPINAYNHIRHLTNDFYYYRIGIRYGLMDGLGNPMIGPLYHDISNKYKNDKYLSYKTKPSYLLVEDDNRYGVIDSFGNEITGQIYKKVILLGDFPLFAVQDPKSELWGVINKENDLVLPYRYSLTSINFLTVSESTLYILEEDNFVAYNHIGQRLKVYEKESEIFSLNDLIILEFNGNRYLLGENGETISDAYSDIDPFGDSLLLVQIENKYGIYDKRGNIVLASDYTSIVKSGNFYSKADDIYFARNKDGIQILNSKGVLLSPDFFDKKRNLGQHVCVLSNKEGNVFYNIEEKSMRFIEKWKDLRLIADSDLYFLQYDKGWTLISTRDTSIHIDCDSFYLRTLIKAPNDKVVAKYETRLFISRGDQYLAVDQDYKTLIPIDFIPKKVYHLDNQDFYKYSESNQNFNLIRASDNKKVFEEDYPIILLERSEIFVLKNREGLRGAITLAGDTIIPFKYYSIHIGNEYVTAIQDDDVIHKYNTDNELIVLPEGAKWKRYESYNNSSDMIVFRQNKLDGCIHTSGKVMVPAEYDKIIFHRSGVVEGKKRIFSNYYSQQGELIQCYRRKSLRF